MGTWGGRRTERHTAVCGGGAKSRTQYDAPCTVLIYTEDSSPLTFLTARMKEYSVGAPPLKSVVASGWPTVDPATSQRPPGLLPFALTFFIGKPPRWHHTQPGVVTGPGVVSLLKASATVPFVVSTSMPQCAPTPMLRHLSETRVRGVHGGVGRGKEEGAVSRRVHGYLTSPHAGCG